MRCYWLFLLLLFLPFDMRASFVSDEMETVPVLYQGRVRPLEVAARQWLSQWYHKEALQKSDLAAFHTEERSALELLWQMHLQGHEPWDESPLFWIQSAALKKLLDLPLKQQRFSYAILQTRLQSPQNSRALASTLIRDAFHHSYYENEGAHKYELGTLASGLWVELRDNTLVVLHAPSHSPWQHLKGGDVIAEGMHRLLQQRPQGKDPLAEEAQGLLLSLQQYTAMGRGVRDSNARYSRAYSQARLPREEISAFLEGQESIHSRLQQSSPWLRLLPSGLRAGEWLGIDALELLSYDAEKESLQPIGNTTAYDEEAFRTLQRHFQSLPQSAEALAFELNRAYENLAGTVARHAEGKALHYPSKRQLLVERWLYQSPLTPLTVALYGFASLFFLLALAQERRRFLYRAGLITLLLAFACHTLLIALRCYVLQRPPVSNMYETVVYVPWISVLCALALSLRFHNRFLLLGASLSALALLLILKVTGLSSSMENVQAVLDSQYWLIIHVLLVVGSYGIFATGGILGHIYLWNCLRQRRESPAMRELSRVILQTMYVGTAMIIPGTILGGVWAAESWGRFWDWDPKESWAFITSCTYLLWIHAYTFGKVRRYGLAIGAVVGLLAMTFTWYGVNYVLGTGLHTYGFGSGGESVYYAYLFGETLFLLAALCLRKRVSSRI